MSNLNFELIQENVWALKRKHNLTEKALAEIAGMSQPNISKALNRNEPKQFTIDQLFRIASHFGISIDELVGNTAASEADSGPRAVLEFITGLLCESKLRFTTINVDEMVYEADCPGSRYSEHTAKEKTIAYPAFYFADYQHPEDFARSNLSPDDVDFDFMSRGNDAKFQCLNHVLKSFLPLVKLYRETEIPDEAFQMILRGYLEQLPEK